MTNSKDLQQLIIEGIQERKGRGITVVDMSHIEAACTSQFIIAQGSSSTQVDAIADSVREYLLENAGIKPYNYDGYQTSEWIVIDYGSIMVHIFLPDARERYNLEDLWNDATIVNIPDLD
jgi:ribosome-associated protein